MQKLETSRIKCEQREQQDCSFAEESEKSNIGRWNGLIGILSFSKSESGQDQNAVYSCKST